MSIDHAALPARVRRGILMVVIAAPLNLYGFIPHSLLRRKKIANPKTDFPACFGAGIQANPDPHMDELPAERFERTLDSMPGLERLERLPSGCHLGIFLKYGCFPVLANTQGISPVVLTRRRSKGKIATVTRTYELRFSKRVAPGCPR